MYTLNRNIVRNCIRCCFGYCTKHNLFNCFFFSPSVDVGIAFQYNRLVRLNFACACNLSHGKRVEAPAKFFFIGSIAWTSLISTFVWTRTSFGLLEWADKKIDSIWVIHEFWEFSLHIVNIAVFDEYWKFVTTHNKKIHCHPTHKITMKFLLSRIYWEEERHFEWMMGNRISRVNEWWEKIAYYNEKRRNDILSENGQKWPGPNKQKTHDQTK